MAGTGANMSGEGTLVEYLLQCLDTLSGHWMREGEQVLNALTLIPSAAQLHKAQAIPPFASYGVGEKMRALGLSGSIAGLPTSVLPDEILLPGDGQVRALISLGGNPATAFPDQLKTIEALRSLDLLVQSDPQMSATAQLADYVIAPKLPYEVPGTTFLADFGSMLTGFGFRSSYAQYTPAIVDPPDDSDVIEHWEVLYRIAQRMGVPLKISPGLGDLMADVGAPTQLDMVTRPTTDELLELTHAGSRIPLAEVKRHSGGAFHPTPEVWVEPKDPGWDHHLDVGNGEMLRDLANVAERDPDPADDAFPFRLISRRMMHVHNSPTIAMPANRPRYNPAFLNPEDLQMLELTPGDLVTISSRHATIPAIVADDPTLRSSLVSMTHGFGGLPESDHDVHRAGASPARLSTNDEVFDRYTGQPRMSNIPSAHRAHARTGATFVAPVRHLFRSAIRFGSGGVVARLALSDHLRVVQRADLSRGEPPREEHVVGVGTGRGHRATQGSRRPREPRGRCRLQQTVALDDRSASDDVRVPRRLVHPQDRSEARIGPFQLRTPFVAGPLPDDIGDCVVQDRPAVTVGLLRERVGVEAELLEQVREELRLPRTDRDVFAVTRLVHVVVGRTRVVDVGAPLVVPPPERPVTPDHRHQQRGAVDHGGIDHLPLPRPLRLEQRTHHAEGEQHSPTPEVGDQVQRWRGRGVATTDVSQHARDSEVVDVVPGRLRERTVLAPPRHASVHQARVVRATLIRPDPEALDDARAEPFQHHVRVRDEAERAGDPVRMLEIEPDRSATAIEDR